MQNRLSEKHGVSFVTGEVSGILHKNNKIDVIEYKDGDHKAQQLGGFDKYIVCGGTGSVYLGRMMGLKVPIMGLKGHSINVHSSDKETPDGTYIYIPENL
jgi:glycine/D-amino acid oxidase-like deaminating enzyme